MKSSDVLVDVLSLSFGAEFIPIVTCNARPDTVLLYYRIVYSENIHITTFISVINEGTNHAVLATLQIPLVALSTCVFTGHLPEMGHIEKISIQMARFHTGLETGITLVDTDS